MDRRSLLSAGILAPLGLAAGLAGCKQPDPNSPGPLTVNNVANDAILVSRGLQAAWSEISQLTTIPPATLAKIQSDIQLVENDANLIATKEATAATPWIKELGPLVVDAASLALPFIPGGSPLQAILQAAISVLPAMFAAVGLSGAPGRATYSPDAARLILAGATGQGAAR
jgi:hypothetical protein